MSILLVALLAMLPLSFLGTSVAFAAGDLTVKVYNDAGRDGVDTGGTETGVVGVSVSLYSIDNLLVGLVNTGAGGIAAFPNIPDGSYRVEVSAPSNYVVSVPGNDTNPGLVSFVQISGAATTVRVGLRQLSGVGGTDAGAPPNSRNITTRVWDDLDADGIQDAGEPGLGGVELQLLDSSNSVIRTSVPVTGTLGRYTFGDVPAGIAYTIRIQSAPVGYALTRQDVSSFDGRDSDAVLATFPPALASVPVGGRGVNIDSVDIGFARGSISGFVWRDVDADGLYDVGIEPRINGVTVQLIDDATNSVLATTTSRSEFGDGASDGVYKFPGLALNTSYRVRIPASEFQAGALLFGAATPPNIQDRGSINGITSAGVPAPGDFVETAVITLDASNVAGGSNIDSMGFFGFYKGAVGDFVWFDVNRDGLQTDETTFGQNGLLLFVDDGRGGGIANDGIRNGGELSTLTDNDPNSGLPGFYTFDDLPLGPIYRIVLDSSNFAGGATLEGIGSSTATQGTTAGGATYYYIETPNLTPGAPTYFAADFGLVRSDIGNYAFIDLNGNGVFDEAASAVIPDLTVRLYRASTNTLVSSTTTDATGVYTISNVPATGYYATFDLSTADPSFAGFVGSVKPITTTIDPTETTYVDYTDIISPAVNATTWRTEVFTPAVGLVNAGIDAGFFEPTTIAGRAFFDANNDAQDNASPEPGMRSITVELRRAADLQLVATTTTAAGNTGVYTFTNVLPGNYVVDFVNPDEANFNFVTADLPAQGDPLASDVDVTGRTPLIAVTSGTPVADVDAGFTGRALVDGRIFLDNDGSNTQNAGDSTLVGATATLTVEVNLPNLVLTYNPVNALAEPTGATDPNYAFPNLPSGTNVTYTLDFAAPAGSYVASTADQGGDDAVDSDGPSITLNNPTAGESFDFDQGYFENVTITARVFEEDSGAAIDNQYAIADSGIANVTVTLETSTGTAVLSDTTDATGLITFTVAPGAYRLNIDQTDSDLSGLTASPGNTDPVAVAGSPLASGQSSLTDTAGANSFGYYLPATITGRVFFDRNLDNLQAGEPGMQNVTVSIASGPSAPGSVTTDATGTYTFTGLLPGNYVVRFANPDTANFAFIGAGDSNVILPGAFSTSDTGTITAGYGATVNSGANAGFIGRSTVNGYTFEDGNYDGQWGGVDDSDLPSASVNLTVTVNLTNRLTTTITRTLSTDGTGNYSFDGLPGGAAVTFDLAFTPPTATPAYLVTLADVGSDTTDSDGTAALTSEPLSSNATQTRDQGYYQPVTITARVFEENSGTIDNQYQAGNTGIADVTVTLEPNGGGTAVASDVTDSTGLITFTVVPGDYQLNIDQTDTDLTGLTASPGHTDPVAVFGTPLISGETSFTDTTGRNSFGYYIESAVSGRVYFDRNLDNLKANEPGVQNVTVNLRDSTGTSVISSTTTTSTGVYTFTNVAAGDYIVEFVNPDATNFAFIAAGDSDITDAATGRTAAVTVPYGTTLANVDGGAIGLAAVTGNTFVDGNYNGLQGDAADADLNAVTANLTMNVNIAGRLTTTITRTATTAAGAFSFASLPGGAGVTFGLAFAPPTAIPAYLATLADVGADNTIDSDGATELTNQSITAGGTQDRDQGYYQPVTITARVFNDSTLPLNNQWNVGENGIGGIQVVLETNLAGTAVQTQTTTTNGLVTFTVPPGDYRLNIGTVTGFAPSPGNTEPTPVAGTPLTSGQSSLTQATPVGTTNVFGYFQPGTVTGNVFFDGRTAAPDNLRAGESPMTGVTVRLLDNALAEVANTTTSATGVYTFTNVVPGNHTVEFVNPDATNFAFSTTVAGDNNVSALSGNNGRTAQFSLTGGNTFTRNAATVGRSNVTGATFVDGTADGRQGGTADATLNGVTVNLTLNVNLPNLATTITRSATTAAGAYNFAALPGGASTAEASFNVAFTPPAATPVWNVTTADAPPDDTGDSDSELSNQPLSPNTTADRDQGYYQNVTITARVFDERTTVNNTFETGELGISGVTVGLEPGGFTQVTNATGLVTFTVRPDTSYTLSVPTDPATFTRSPGNTASVAVATLTSGQSNTTAPFGYYRASTFTGTAWFDSNGDGIADAGEPGMQNITVSLVGNNSGEIITTTTTITGSYTFTDVAPTGGALADTEYRLCFSLPTGFAYTLKGTTLTTDGNSDVNVGGVNDGCSDAFTVASNNTVNYIDAGYIGTYSAGNLVWNDLNANGIQDTGEPGLAGATVTLAITTTGSVINDNNPTITITATSTTSADLAANYEITRVPPAAGFEVVSVTAPFSYQATLSDQGGDDTRDSDPLGGYPVVIPPSITDLDFGFYQTASIGDRVWIDLDGNESYQAGVDAGLGGLTVELLDTTTIPATVVATTTTASSEDIGFYQFLDVAPGTYAVQFTAPTGFVFVNDSLGSINVDSDNDADLTGLTENFTVTSGLVLGTVDAGLFGTAAINGRAWIDENGNDIRDTAELGRLDGVGVDLSLVIAGSTEPIVLSTNTGLDGSYSFSDLPPGTATITFTAPAGYAPVTADVGTDDTIDSDGPVATFTLTAGATVNDTDTGYRGTGAISGRAWFDENGNDVRDPAEAARLAGVAVELSLAVASLPQPVTLTTTTAADGSYSFADLLPGTATITFTTPTGYTAVAANAGIDETIDSDGPVATFILDPAATVTDLDLGVRGTAAINGLAWIDANRNDVRDSGEADRLAGVAVELSLAVVGRPTPLVISTTTAVDGSYSFANLPAGNATVTFTTPANYVPATADVGSDDTVDSDGPVATFALAAGATVNNVDQGYARAIYRLYMPMLATAPVTTAQADLTVSFSVTPASPQALSPAGIAVTVTNNGAASASGFWVDFYINPLRAPNVNEPWNELCALEPCFGLAWFYDGTLQPGQSVVLNSNPRSATNPNGFTVEATDWRGYFANGSSKLYAYVDSWNRDGEGSVRDPLGAVPESNETNNRAEQDITVTPAAAPAAAPSTADHLVRDRNQIRP